MTPTMTTTTAASSRARRRPCLLRFLLSLSSVLSWLMNGVEAFSWYNSATKRAQASRQHPFPREATRIRARTGLAQNKRRNEPSNRRFRIVPLQAASSSFFEYGGNALYTQVISDVDDTLKSSGGVNIAGVALGGIDVQYARGEFYPGVAEFMLQVSLGKRQQRKNPPPKVAILTARAQEFKLALELKDDSSLAVAFRQAGEDVGIDGWGLGPVLYGSVAEWIVQDRKGLRKFANFEQLLQQDPTHGQIMDYVYVGDTGELDQEAGETMLREYPTFVKAVFLHCVYSERRPTAAVPPPKFVNGRPIIFFRTYVGAAVAATQLELMSRSGLKSVMVAACAKLENVPRDSDKWTDLLRDIDRASVLLQQQTI